VIVPCLNYVFCHAAVAPLAKVRFDKEWVGSANYFTEKTAVIFMSFQKLQIYPDDFGV